MHFAKLHLAYIFTLIGLFHHSHSFSWSAPHETHESITKNGMDFALKKHFLSTPDLIGCILNSTNYTSAQLQIIDGNRMTDMPNMSYTAHLHFDDEQFRQGFYNLVGRRIRAKMALKEGDAEEARKQIGIALHGVQDFYSHSNWVELGRSSPSLATSGKVEDFGVALADLATPACQPCEDPSGCDNNVITDKLTSGYFKNELDIVGNVIIRAKGKCNHGGRWDAGVEDNPAGGINKDGEDSAHGHLHQEAARVAVLETANFLLDYRTTVGIELFEMLLGIDRDDCR